MSQSYADGPYLLPVTSPPLSLPSLTLVNYWTHWLGLPYKADSWLAKHYGGRIGEKTRWAVWIAKSSECKSKLHPSFLTRSCANTSKGANFLPSLLLSAGHEEHFHSLSLYGRSQTNMLSVLILDCLIGMRNMTDALFCFVQSSGWMQAGAEFVLLTCSGRVRSFSSSPLSRCHSEMGLHYNLHYS